MGVSAVDVIGSITEYVISEEVITDALVNTIGTKVITDVLVATPTTIIGESGLQELATLH